MAKQIRAYSLHLTSQIVNKNFFNFLNVLAPFHWV